jgi:NAD(P)-dependent dehydrogenase (short-subunit alcohol dehydrogenase family)
MNDGVPSGIRPVVDRSWERSRRCGLDEGLVPDLPYQPRSEIASMFVRAGTPEEIALLAAFLAGPDSDFMTGVAVPIDGGWTVR